MPIVSLCLWLWHDFDICLTLTLTLTFLHYFDLCLLLEETSQILEGVMGRTISCTCFWQTWRFLVIHSFNQQPETSLLEKKLEYNWPEIGSPEIGSRNCKLQILYIYIYSFLKNLVGNFEQLWGKNCLRCRRKKAYKRLRIGPPQARNFSQSRSLRIGRPQPQAPTKRTSSSKKSF